MKNRRHPLQQRWIRSLAIAAQHIDDPIDWELTHLRELVLYGENFENTYDKDRPVSMGAVATFIDNNKNLSSLEIDLNEYHYRSGYFSPSPMHTIDRHPVFTRLTWHVP